MCESFTIKPFRDFSFPWNADLYFHSLNYVVCHDLSVCNTYLLLHPDHVCFCFRPLREKDTASFLVSGPSETRIQLLFWFEAPQRQG